MIFCKIMLPYITMYIGEITISRPCENIVSFDHKT